MLADSPTRMVPLDPTNVDGRARRRARAVWTVPPLLPIVVLMQDGYPGRFLPGWRWLAALVAAIALPITVAATPQAPSWEELGRRGFVISGIDIQIDNVFDADQPEAKTWYGRAANFIHIRTREEVVRRELLFKVGDRVDAVKIHDTERVLRTTLDTSRDVTIVPERIEGRTVWARVIFKDAWTLNADLHYGHVGGQNKYTARIHERNFLGLGKGLELSHDHTFERNVDTAAYYDPQLFGSLWTLSTNYQKLSDGKARLFDLERPFYTVATPWAVQLSVSDQLETLSLYDLGHTVYRTRDTSQSAVLSASWAYRRTPESASRTGVGFVLNQTRYTNPEVVRPGILPPLKLEDRRLRGPEITWEWLQSRNESFTDLATIGRHETFNLGWDVNLAAGAYTPSLGSGGSGPFFSLTATKGHRLSENTLLLESAVLQGRREQGAWRGGLLANELTVYNTTLRHQTLVADLRVDLSLRPDPESWLYLGGEDGMRGYRNHFRAGDRRWMATVEDRVITDRDLWGLVRVGFVGFVDLGGIHGFGASGWGRTYSDIGAGLRFGNLKGRVSQVLQIVVAVPLVKTPETKGYEIVAGNVLRF